MTKSVDEEIQKAVGVLERQTIGKLKEHKLRLILLLLAAAAVAGLLAALIAEILGLNRTYW